MMITMRHDPVAQPSVRAWKRILSAVAAVGACVLVPVLAPARLAAADAKRPNIIVILVDDMGFSDIGCYGSEIPTPNLDKLGKEGLRFTQFYNTGRCCPSRAALLTGLYSHQAGIGRMLEDDGAPGYRGRLNDHCVTIAEVLGPAGYATAMSGKWHVGQNHGVVPSERGFAHELHAPEGGFYFPDGKKAGQHLYLDGKAIADDDQRLPKDWYSTDLWTGFGLKFIDGARAEKKPFFLYLAFNAPHFPLQAPQDEIAAQRGRYLLGWDVLRDQRQARQVAMGLIAPEWMQAPRPDDVQAWSALGPKQQDRFDHIMAIYAAALAHVDTAVGHLVAGLKERGALDDTLIMFMSDNGGNAEGGPEGVAKGKPLGSVDSEVFCGKSWATLENTPLRRYKHFNHEGGVATPLIVHWPAGFTATDQWRTQPGHLIDVMATCVDVSGATYPTERAGQSVLPMEGRSLVPAFAGQPIQRDALYWEHEGNAAVRVGDMKLVRAGRGGAWELYDMIKDRTEEHDLAAQQPQLVATLSAKWEAWAERAQVKPYPGHAGGKKGKAGAGKAVEAVEAPEE
jgi:arylsulfatase